MKKTPATLTLIAIILLSSCNQGQAPAPDSSEATQQQLATDPTLNTLPEIQALLADGSLTSERLVELSLDRVNAYESDGPGLNALIMTNGRALQTARALDKERREQGPRGPLHGIPVILKDNYDTGDIVTTGGSATLSNGRPDRFNIYLNYSHHFKDESEFQDSQLINPGALFEFGPFWVWVDLLFGKNAQYLNDSEEYSGPGPGGTDRFEYRGNISFEWFF